MIEIPAESLPETADPVSARSRVPSREDVDVEISEVDENADAEEEEDDEIEDEEIEDDEEEEDEDEDDLDEEDEEGVGLQS